MTILNKLYIINFIINVDNFSEYSFMRMQQMNGYDDDDYEKLPRDYTDIIEAYEKTYYLNRRGELEQSYRKQWRANKNTEDIVNGDLTNHKTLFKNFKAFHEWNIDCVMKLNDEESQFIKTLCELILTKRLDMFPNSASMWNATGLYFNKEGKLIICHPR